LVIRARDSPRRQEALGTVGPDASYPRWAVVFLAAEPIGVPARRPDRTPLVVAAAPFGLFRASLGLSALGSSTRCPRAPLRDVPAARHHLANPKAQTGALYVTRRGDAPGTVGAASVLFEELHDDDRCLQVCMTRRRAWSTLPFSRFDTPATWQNRDQPRHETAEPKLFSPEANRGAVRCLPFRARGRRAQSAGPAKPPCADTVRGG